MNHRLVFLFLFLMLICHSNCISEKQDDLTRRVVLIGNEESDSIQLEMIRELINDGELSLSDRQDAEIISKLIDNWIHNPRIEFFDDSVRKFGHYPIDIETGSPFYPLVLYYQTRMLIWVAFEHGSIWSIPAKRQEVIGEVKANFEKLHKIFPKMIETIIAKKASEAVSALYGASITAADFQIDTDEKELQEIADEIIKRIKK